MNQNNRKLFVVCLITGTTIPALQSIAHAVAAVGLNRNHKHYFSPLKQEHWALQRNK